MDFDKDVSPLIGSEVETCTAVIEDTNLDAISCVLEGTSNPIMDTNNSFSILCE